MSKATKRKHVVKEIEEDLTVPTEAQHIVQLVEPRGNNLHEVTDPFGEHYLVSMPTKYRRTIWVKRGDYVLIESIPEGDKVKGEIIKILTRTHVRFYQSQNCWPQQFEKKKETIDNGVDSVEKNGENKANKEMEEDGLFVNTNRRPQDHDTTETESDTSTEASDSD